MRLSRKGLTLPSKALWQSGTAWRDNRYRLCIAFGAACAIGACAPDDSLELPPVGYAGSVGETFRTRDTGDEPRLYANRVNTVVDLKSYVWQPWFVTLDGGAEVANDLERGGTTGNSDEVLFGGNLNIGILPVSRYPTTLSASHTESQISGNTGGSDFIQDRFGVNSTAIISSDLRTLLSASYETVEQPDFGTEDRQDAALSVNKTFETDRLALDLRYKSASFDSVTADDIDETDIIGTVRYDASPAKDFTSQTTSTAIYSEETTDTRDLNETVFQGTTTAQWRPRDRPFTVNGALRTLAEDIDLQASNNAGIGNSTQTERLLTVGTLGMNYPISRQLTTNLGLTARGESVVKDSGGVTNEAIGTSDTIYSTNLIGGVNYQSLSELVYGFDWRWDASASGNVGYASDTALEDSEAASLGHNVQRQFENLPLTPVQFNFSQQVLVQRSSEEGATPSLFHSTSLSHRKFEEGVSTFARFSLSDRRDIAVSDADEFQVAQLQLDRQTEIDFLRQWFANLSLQVTRQKTGSSEANVTASADGTLSYREQDLFSVSNLSFLSELTLSALGLEDFVVESDRNIETDDFRTQWRNLVEYRIGRIVASMEATVFQEDEDFGNLVMLRVRRDFNGNF